MRRTRIAAVLTLATATIVSAQGFGGWFGRVGPFDVRVACLLCGDGPTLAREAIDISTEAPRVRPLVLGTVRQPDA